MGLFVLGLIHALLSAHLCLCSSITARTLLLETVLSAERRLCIAWPVMVTLLLLLLHSQRWRQGFPLGVTGL